MFEKYIRCLFKQFCDAKGLDVTNFSKSYSNDFVDWIIERKSLLYMYREYLASLDFDYSPDDVLEVGKGRYDSLSPIGINLVSSFAETIGKRNSKLYIDRGIPLIIQQDKIIIPSENILLTYNPYFESEILGWPLIHNVGERNISIGVFGEIIDADSSRKTKLLEELNFS